MLNKKLIVLVIFFISLVAVSGVSAAEDAGDVAAVENDMQTDEIITMDMATDEMQDDALDASEDDESDDAQAASNDESDDALTVSNDEDILSGDNCYVNCSYIGDDERGTPDRPFRSIGDAISSCSDGDTIHIADGVYASDQVYIVDKKLNLERWGFGQVVLSSYGNTILYCTVDEINIIDLTFKDVHVDEGDGGAIYFANGLNNSYISGSFIGNFAPRGGAIFVNGNIENSFISAYFADNSALMGGAIYAGSITNTEIDGDFINNTAIFELESLADVEFGLGGAIFSEGIIEDSSIEGDFILNRASNFGGAIFVREGMDRSNVTGGFMHNFALIGGAVNAPAIRNSKIISSFVDNTALIGGAINTNIINNTEIESYFINNTADLNLMDLIDDGTKMQIEDYLNEYADENILEYILNYIMEPEMGLGFGGGITVVGIMENSTIFGEFINNGGADAGGAISVLGVVEKSLISGDFELNHASLGGSLFLPVVKDSNIVGGFSSNYAVQGGAIFAVFANHTNISGEFTGNCALNNKDKIGADLLAWGGAICIDGVLENSNIDGTFLENMATELGGAIGGIDFVVNSNITGYFIKNSAKIGGALDLPYLQYSAIDGYFVNNTAAIGGAIMAAYIDNAQINAHFINNTVLDYDVEDVKEIEYNDVSLPTGLGGAISIVGTLKDSNFTGDFILNTAKAGGAIFIYAVGFVTDQDSSHPVRNNTFNSNFVGNYAKFGAAIFINGTSFQNKFNSNFLSNVAMLDGIVYVYGESIEDSISKCLFMNNTAASIISLGSPAGTSITNNIFLNSTKVYDINAIGGSKLIAENNWFGHNATNYKESPKINGTVNCTSWLFLNAVADPASVSYMGSSNIVFCLFVYDNITNSSSVKYDHTLLEPVNLTIVSANGEVDKNVSTFGEVIKFTSNGKKGNVTASIGSVQDTIAISCIPRLIGNNLVMDYLGDNYKIQVFNADGDAVGGQVVKMTVNGKTYTIESDKEGYATLPIYLKPKTYDITSTYNGVVLKNTLKVKNTLKTKKSFKVKKSSKKLVLKATLKWSNGKAIANKKVSFKFKGKKFTVTTDKDGVAKITLTVKLISKGKIKIIFKKKSAALRLGKKYKMVVSYRNETVNSKLVVKK
jgi:hypothetical protein